MFGLFKKDENIDEPVGPNGHYEGQVLCADYAAGDSDEYHDIYAHGRGKMTVTLEDGTVEIYDGEWDVGRFHGKGRLTTITVDGAEESIEGNWIEGNKV